MSKATFLFQIGDTLTHRAMIGTRGTAQRLFVVGRLIDESPSGVELYYRVRPISGLDESAFTREYFTVLEIELCLHPDCALPRTG